MLDHTPAVRLAWMRSRGAKNSHGLLLLIRRVSHDNSGTEDDDDNLQVLQCEVHVWRNHFWLVWRNIHAKDICIRILVAHCYSPGAYTSCKVHGRQDIRVFSSFFRNWGKTQLLVQESVDTFKLCFLTLLLRDVVGPVVLYSCGVSEVTKSIAAPETRSSIAYQPQARLEKSGRT